uniref:(northern house mosquito) hypothetical protein n=1 Tax=Culex pipiens TaxID=7175 RepID=A0A8D8CAE1_CULPI
MHLPEDPTGGNGPRAGPHHPFPNATRSGLARARRPNPGRLQASPRSARARLAPPSGNIPHNYAEDACPQEEPRQPARAVEGTQHPGWPAGRSPEAARGCSSWSGGQRAGHLGPRG